MFRELQHFCAVALDRIDYGVTLARLRVVDWLAGPMPETLGAQVTTGAEQPSEIDAAEGSAALRAADDHIDTPRAALSAD